MTDHLDDLRAAARAVLAAHAPTESHPVGDLDGALWKELENLGFTSLTVPIELEGAGGDLLDAAVVVRESTYAAVPLAEATFLAGPLLAAAGLVLPRGPVTAAAAPDLEVTSADDGSRFLSGVLQRVPWIECAEHVVVLVRSGDRDAVALVATGTDGLDVRPGRNIAGEPRGTAVLDSVRALAFAELDGSDWFCRFEMLAATARAVQMAGAAGAALAATDDYVRVRHQFGRPLVAFQAVQHQLARLAADVVAVEISSDTAVLALRSGDPQAELVVAAAKAEASSLARPIAAAAHQAHGAIGFTVEHTLGAVTKRLWSWREEYGNELHWWGRIADLVQRHDGDVWALVTGTEGERT